MSELMIERRVEIKRYPKYLGADTNEHQVRVMRTSPAGWMLQLRGQTQMATADYLSANAARELIVKLQEVIAAIEPQRVISVHGEITEHGPELVIEPSPFMRAAVLAALGDEAEERGSEG